MKTVIAIIVYLLPILYSMSNDLNIEQADIYIPTSNQLRESSESSSSTDSNGSTSSTRNVIDVPFCSRRTNPKTALFYTQLLMSGAAISIGAAFTAVGIMSTASYIPLLSAIVGYWLPSPSLS